MLGYPWDADIASHVKFEDALGRNIILPDVLCRNAQSFQDTVQIIFANQPGFQDIVEGNYDIVDVNTNSTVLKPDSNLLKRHLKDIAFQIRWNKHILPETHLPMNIVNKRRLKPFLES